MRDCPVCEGIGADLIFSMTYCIPDGWPLPSEIRWYKCKCGMIYGDGAFDQAMLDEYYTKYYGYGVSNPDNIERLRADAAMIDGLILGNHGNVVDFGGAGDDGKSVLLEELESWGYDNLHCIGPNEPIPDCDVLYASHVLEHIYDLPETMRRIVSALAPDGLLIVDVPDATGLLRRWRMPILDFNTKHLNHFTLRNLLDLGHHHGLEAVYVKPYELEYAPCYQVHFRRLDVVEQSREHVERKVRDRVDKLSKQEYPLNIWGMGDITWVLMSHVDLHVLNYIDNDPAYRGQTFKGKPVLERPDNDAPILILAQGQRQRLIENIRKAGVTNQIIEI